MAAGKSVELPFRLNGEGKRLLGRGRLRISVAVAGRVGRNPALTRAKIITV